MAEPNSRLAKTTGRPERRTVIVTGASGGIGRACVEAFVASGVNVVMADVDESGAELERASEAGGRAVFVKTDLADEGSVRSLIVHTVDRFGSLDVLVNNAAVLTPMAAVQDTSVEEFDRIVAVNLRGTYLCCRHAYPHLKRDRGCVVNVSSMSGVHGEKQHAIYAATKGAINALTQSMAIDSGPDGIRVNAVCPSSVLTPKTEEMINAAPDPAAVVKLRKSINHLGYTAEPTEVASVILFLASPAASFMTGAIVPVSGGTECGYGVKY